MLSVSAFQTNKLLAELSTFGIGGPAKYFFEVKSIIQMQQVIGLCQKERLPFLVVGKGSNCLFDDRGFNGLVILNKISFCQIQGEQVHVGAGYSFSLLGVQTAKRGLSGLEFASGIPASVGGAVFMNAGASGQETKDCLTKVCFIDQSGELVHFSKESMEFSYRHSSFQSLEGVIVSAEFVLKRCDEARRRQLNIIDYRRKTQPYSDPSIGCIFRNPQGNSAGSLIDQAGCKGVVVGGAQVSFQHANFIVNTQKATAKDVLQLVEVIRGMVREKTGVVLDVEIRCIPYQLEDSNVSS